MAKNTFSRYIWLIELLEQNEDGLTLEEIQEHWLHSTLNPEGKPLPARTFLNHVKAIKEILGYNIEYIRKHYYEKSDRGAARGTWKIEEDDSISTQSRLNAKAYEYNYYTTLYDGRIRRRYKDRFNDELSDEIKTKIRLISKAMAKNCQVYIKIWNNKSKSEEKLLMAPYALNEYDRDWYFLARNESLGTLHVYELKQIKLELSEEPFDFYVYEWEDGKKRKRIKRKIGVQHYKRRKKPIKKEKDPRWRNFMAGGWRAPRFDNWEEIQMKVYGEEMAYWNENWYKNNLVKVLIKEEDYKLVSFYDDPNHPKVITDLLSKGENIEVISPQSLVNTMRTHVQNMAKRYK